MKIRLAGLTLNAFLSWHRSFGINATLGLLGTSIPVMAVAAGYAGDNSPVVAPVLFLLFEALTIITADLVRSWMVGDPCGRGGSSRWMRWHELRKRRWKRGSILCGRMGGHHTPGSGGVGIIDDRHVLTIAPNRSGKGTGLIIPNLLMWPSGVVNTDPKGENCLATYKQRQEAGHTVVAIDPYGVLAAENGGEPLGIEVSYNPLADLDRNARDISEKLTSIVTAIVLDEGSQNVHWTIGARLVITTAVAAVMLKLPQNRRTLAVASDLLKHRTAFLAMIRDAAENPSGPKGLWAVVEAGHAQISGLSDEVRDNWMSTAIRNLEWLSSSIAIQDSLNCTQVRHMSDLGKGNLTLFLVLPPDKLASQAAWLRIIIKKALSGCNSVANKPKWPVLFLLDEFAQLGHMKEIEDALGVLAGYGVKLWPILQDLAQLKRVYPKSWESFVAASGVMHVFGCQDPDTCKAISEMTGTRLRRQWEDSDLSRTDPSGVALLTPDEVRRVTERSKGRLLMFCHGQHPALISRTPFHAVWFKIFHWLHREAVTPDPQKPDGGVPHPSPENPADVFTTLPWEQIRKPEKAPEPEPEQEQPAQEEPGNGHPLGSTACNDNQPRSPSQEEMPLI